jgi:phage shock protein PspC (stress-responsive transcriptional regulator)
MNKTISISISGMVFHIDEFAYEKLKRYLDEIRGHFSENDGRDEIMADIESRIAEIFTTRIGKLRNVVLMDDVDHMMSIMGSPEDYGDGEKKEAKQEYSGDASQARYTNNRSRRIYRDPDDKVLGGVCGGIAAYFDVDPLWFRLAFAAAFFLFGTGFLFYIVLWAVIPEAKTTAQKLEMKGEEVNISNIEKNIREEMEGLKSRFKDFSKETGQNIKENYAPGFRGFVQRLVDGITTIVKYLAIGLVRFIGVLLMIVGIILLVAVMSAAFGGKTWININGSSFDALTMNELLLRFFESDQQLMWSKVALVLTLGVPVILMIYQGIRILFKIKEKQRWINLTAAVLWIIGVIMSFSIISEIGHDFHKRGSEKQTASLNMSSGNTLYLRAKATENEWDEEDMNNKGWHFDFTEDKSLRLFFPKLNIVRSETDSFQLVVAKGALGPGTKEATSRAGEISYSFGQQDSILMLDPYFIIPAAEKWRDQRVKMTLKVPVGKSVYLDPSVEHIIYDIQNVTNTLDREMLSRRWIMSPEGLRCIDCEGLFDENTKANSGNTENNNREEEW